MYVRRCYFIQRERIFSSQFSITNNKINPKSHKKHTVNAKTPIFIGVFFFVSQKKADIIQLSVMFHVKHLGERGKSMTQAVNKIQETDKEKEIIYVDIETIMPNRGQPRTFFDAEGLNELAESIKRYGILQPLTVRKAVENSKYSHFQYELIAGERRLRAAKLLNMEKVPCILMESDSKTSAALAIIENLHRRDLNVFEEASAIASLIEIYHLTQEQVAAKLSMTQAGVANKLRLLRLSNEERELILQNNLTERHARAILRVKNESERLRLLKKIIENSLNVKQTEDYIDKTTYSASESEKVAKVRRLNQKELISSIEKAIFYTRNSGITVKTQQTETDSEIIFTVAIQK